MEVEKIIKKIKGRITRNFKADKELSAAEKSKLLKLPRYQQANIKFFGKNLSIVDADTFLGSYYEIFKKEIYKFISTKKHVTIIDCGANIGLATLYFKINFPDATIIAFEPDPNIYIALKNNMMAFGYDDVICKNEAISDQDTTLNFWLEGGHSGMIVNTADTKGSVQVKATRLKSFLQNYDNVTFLKIDIEGEETKVITDIADQLKKVDFMFLEYHSFIDRDQKLGDLLNIIQAAGMKYYIEEATHKPSPFINREIFFKMDLLANIFCYRP